MKTSCIFRKPLLTIALPALMLISVLNSCDRPSEGSAKAGKHITSLVSATVETTPTPRDKNDDSADDPAIWINKNQPGKSLVIGTDKKGGIAVYETGGTEIKYYSAGDMNNCDLRYGFPLNGDTIDVLASSNRSMQSVSLFSINKNGELDSVHSRIIKSEMKDEVYGLCMYQSKKNGQFYVFVNSKAGEVEQWELFATGHKIDAKLVRAFELGTQTEGMVADDETGILYIGEEQAGIWRFDAEPDAPETGVYIEGSSDKNPNIRYDIEGLAIYKTDSVNGYLVASSQGNYSYAVFNRHGNNNYIGSFRITEGMVDGVEETDGLDITNVSLPGFQGGFLVVQDGFNYDGKKKKSQNYKLVPWVEIEKIIQQFKQQLFS